MHRIIVAALFLALVLGVEASTCPCQSGYKCMIDNCVLDVVCPKPAKYGSGPPTNCKKPSDPKGLPAHPIESWFTRDVFNDIFPQANIGWGPNSCWPYSYESFQIGIRYFPSFANQNPVNSGYSLRENAKRELAAFFAHIIQETGENNGDLYRYMPEADATACFYRGGFYNWFEGGPESYFIQSINKTGYQPEDGDQCDFQGRYCEEEELFTYFYPCNLDKTSNGAYLGCYFGRGALQLSYNYNYGQFQDWINSQGYSFDLLKNPNLIMTQLSPPLAIMASLWFFMTPQPPKPAIHDIIIGNWVPGPVNEAAGYVGAIFGPSSLIINSECGGEDTDVPGGAGENRRIKAFRFFCDYFGVDTGPDFTLSCKDMPQRFDTLVKYQSWEPDWLNDWKQQPCNCTPAIYQGMIPYYDPNYFDISYASQNEANRKRCIESIYANPSMYNMASNNSLCLTVPMQV